MIRFRVKQRNNTAVGDVIVAHDGDGDDWMSLYPLRDAGRNPGFSFRIQDGPITIEAIEAP